MKLRLSSSFFPLLKDEHRYLVMVGGAGSGKSETAARKVLYRCMTEGNHRFLIMRKVRRTLKDSVIRVILTILRENEIPIEYNKTDRLISFVNGSGQRNEILFEGVDDPEKIKSIKGITSIWLEETTEFTKEDFMQIDLRLREPTPFYKQIMLTFNPDEAQAPWLKEMFFDTKNLDALVHESTVEDNPVKEIREEYKKRLDALNDPVYYQIYRLGKWALARGLIYNWDVVSLPVDIKFDEIFYAGDFGFSIDPAAVLRIYRKANEYWLQEVIYETGLTNQDLGRRMKQEGVSGEDITYWDSAEPKSIQELCDMNFTAIPAEKGPDSVKAGIDYLRSQKIHIVENSPNILAERKVYKWRQDKNMNDLPIPVALKDHAMSAARYGIYTNAKQGGGDEGIMWL